MPATSKPFHLWRGFDFGSERLEEAKGTDLFGWFNIALTAKADAGALYKSALEGSTQAAIWWTKTRMKWSDKQEIEHSGNAVWTIQNIYEA